MFSKPLVMRRPARLCRVALVMCLLAGGACGQGWLLAEDWPRWRGPRGDGTWQGPPISERWPESGLTSPWRQPIGGGYSGAIVAGQRVLVMDRQKEPAEIERLLAFDADNGDPLWKMEYTAAYGKLTYGSGPRAAPTVHKDRVYCLGSMGHLHCVDLASGSVRWSHDCMAEFGSKLPEWGFAASPLVWQNLVIAHVAGQPDGSLMAFDVEDGREVWRASADPAGYATPILVERDGGPQLVAWTPENVIGLDPRSGKLEWSIPYKVTYGVAIATPICQEGLVFVTGYWEGSKAIRLTGARQAALAWEENDNLRGLMSQPLYREGHVYCLDKRFGVTCFKLADGQKLWDDANRITPRDSNPQASLVWLGQGDRALSLNAEGELALGRLNPTGYQELARAKIIGPTWAHPAYAGRRVYARDDQELVCVELPVEE